MERHKSFVDVVHLNRPVNLQRCLKITASAALWQIHAAQVADEEERIEVDAMSSLAHGFMGKGAPSANATLARYLLPVFVDGTSTMIP